MGGAAGGGGGGFWTGAGLGGMLGYMFGNRGAGGYGGYNQGWGGYNRGWGGGLWGGNRANYYGGVLAGEVLPQEGGEGEEELPVQPLALVQGRLQDLGALGGERHSLNIYEIQTNR